MWLSMDQRRPARWIIGIKKFRTIGSTIVAAWSLLWCIARPVMCLAAYSARTLSSLRNFGVGVLNPYSYSGRCLACNTMLHLSPNSSLPWRKARDPIVKNIHCSDLHILTVRRKNRYFALLPLFWSSSSGDRYKETPGIPDRELFPHDIGAESVRAIRPLNPLLVSAPTRM
ncbi:hypothetical protein C8F04DRAFT_471176 [Mycena alexandri]|uniref:Uncharacterized protein n=1 Tax=Mycena alexandri TaxID=1745969 RepID=A0AAD6SZF2_9AGAR|nr:hypothetical protein C8F04DRAFT_471176 [Mycena alexandri]